MMTILLTGATDGIGLETAKRFAKEGHSLLLHGRNTETLAEEILNSVEKIGVDILYRASVSEEFAEKSGAYYDNDYEEFARLHPFALNKSNRRELVEIMDGMILRNCTNLRMS